MRNYLEEQVDSFAKNCDIKNVKDILAALKNLLADTIHEFLAAELDTHLGYGKHDYKSKKIKNSRNGKSIPKGVITELGEIQISLPRDREGTFEPQIVKKYKKSLLGIEGKILSLYAKGMPIRDIQAYYNHIYGEEIAPALVANISERMLPRIKKWQIRPLQEKYATTFITSINYEVSFNNAIVKKAVYLVVGVDMKGIIDVLGIWIGEEESESFWLSVLSDLKSSGIKDILATYVVNSSGFSEASGAVYPQAVVHKLTAH